MRFLAMDLDAYEVAGFDLILEALLQTDISKLGFVEAYRHAVLISVPSLTHRTITSPMFHRVLRPGRRPRWPPSRPPFGRQPQTDPGPPGTPGDGATERCRDFNNGICRRDPCRFSHTCITCGRAHRQVDHRS